MTAKLELLPTPPMQSKQDVVRMLKDWLEQAERGEIIGLALIGVSHDECTMTAFEPGPNMALLIAATVRLQHRILHYGDDAV